MTRHSGPQKAWMLRRPREGDSKGCRGRRRRADLRRRRPLEPDVSSSWARGEGREEAQRGRRNRAAMNRIKGGCFPSCWGFPPCWSWRPGEQWHPCSPPTLDGTLSNNDRNMIKSNFPLSHSRSGSPAPSSPCGPEVPGYFVSLVWGGSRFLPAGISAPSCLPSRPASVGTSHETDSADTHHQPLPAASCQTEPWHRPTLPSPGPGPGPGLPGPEVPSRSSPGGSGPGPGPSARVGGAVTNCDPPSSNCN